MASFEVMRALRFGDGIVQPHELVDLTDAALINSLLAAGRIAPADDETARRIRRPNAWTVPRTTSVAPGDSRLSFRRH